LRLRELLGLPNLVERIEAGYLEQTPGGVHWLYRCEEITGNAKLAQRLKRPEEKQQPKDKWKVLIETRGEGGFMIAAPSHGKVHPSGKPYVLVRGGVASLATITPEERTALWNLARTFHQPEKVRFEDPKGSTSAARSGTRPGDDFNRRASWAEILEPAGWTKVLDRNDAPLWRRPGKGEGWSASTNYAGSGLLYCWSTSTDFEAERGYSKFAAYAILHHNGDYKAAAKKLAQDGYGTPAPEREAAESADGLPSVVVNDRPLRDQTTDALGAIVAANDPPQVFVRNGGLSRVRCDEEGRPIIELFSEASLRGRMTRVANFVNAVEVKDELFYTHVAPPVDVVRDLLTLGSWPDLPALEGITETPVLRPDGTILDQPGYDPATRLIYLIPPGFKPGAIPERPTTGDIERALSLIGEATGEFPFADGASRANALALLMTHEVRTAISGSVPLALVDKPRAGTGASLFADVVAIIATGRDAEMSVAPKATRNGASGCWRCCSPARGLP
jgi:hypothetical protein